VTRVLVTGGTGFVGTPCVRNAVARGAEAHVLARQERPVPGVTFHAADLFDAARVKEVVNAVRPSHLLHLAWVATPGVYWTSPENERWVQASIDLLEAFTAAGGQRAVLTGTCAEYDWTGDGVCRERRTHLRPATLYGQRKDWLRDLSKKLADDRGLSLAWARLFFLYGPGEHPARLVPSVTRALLAGQPAEVTEGTQQRDFLHVDDAADALVSLLFSDLTGPVNVASGTAVSVRAVVARIGVVTGRPELVRFGVKPTPPGEPPLLVADVTRLRDELGWVPRVGLEDGLADTVRWWQGRPDAGP
jgi:nucleoside-diphosphate-sugar epimerase